MQHLILHFVHNKCVEHNRVELLDMFLHDIFVPIKIWKLKRVQARYLVKYTQFFKCLEWELSKLFHPWQHDRQFNCELDCSIDLPTTLTRKSKFYRNSSIDLSTNIDFLIKLGHNALFKI